MALGKKLASSLNIMQLIYCSHSTHSEDKTEFEHDVHDILDRSLIYNILHEIMGALTTDGNMFAHVIEGAPGTVENLYSKIMRNARHDRVLTLQYTLVHVRLFSLWPIAFLRVGARLHAKALHARSTPLELRKASVSILKAFRPMFLE